MKKEIEVPKKQQPKIKDDSMVKTVDMNGNTLNGSENHIQLLTLKPHKTVLTQYIRTYQINQRQGTASTKTRAEVTGTTKKVYKQKGTGKARHGSKKAPIFKGGGVVGGPKPKEYRLKINKKQKILSLLSALRMQYMQGNILKLTHEMKDEKIKTKTMALLLKKLGFYHKKILFVLTKDVSELFIPAVRNIKNVSYTLVDSLNAYEVVNASEVIFVNNAFTEVIGSRVKTNEN